MYKFSLRYNKWVISRCINEKSIFIVSTYADFEEQTKTEETFKIPYSTQAHWLEESLK